MAKLIAFISMVSIGAANAHPSLIAHEHPHGFTAFAGLDTLLLAAFMVALGLAAYRQVRS
jgi:hypothetical protein